MELPWQSSEITALKDYHEAGLTASQMAPKIGIGRSHTAVLERLREEGFVTKAKAFVVDEPRYRAVIPERPAPSQPTLKPDRLRLPFKLRVKGLEEPGAGRVTMANVSNNTCRWPIGDVGDADFHFCGHQPHEGLTYCKHHARTAYPKFRP